MKINAAISKRILSQAEIGLEKLAEMASDIKAESVIVVCEDKYGFLRFEICLPEDVRKADTVIWTPKAPKKPVSAK